VKELIRKARWGRLVITSGCKFEKREDFFDVEELQELGKNV
jgi:hypothetical protein